MKINFFKSKLYFILYLHDVIIGYYDKNGKYNRISANLSKGLLSCKTMTTPEGFGDELIREEVKEADKKFGFIGALGYNGVDTKSLNAELNVEDTLDTKLRKFFEIQREYVENVIGKKLSNVELNKFYKYFLKTSFPERKVSIFPFHDKNIGQLKYVVIAKSEENENSYLYFLYDEKTGEFVEQREEQINEMQERGFSSNKYKKIGRIL